MKGAASETESEEGSNNYEAPKKVDVKHSSIQTGPVTLNTCVGPIHEWAPVPENLPNHPTLAFFGKRRTGKSTTITNILYHCCRDIPFGIVMSDTAYAGYWQEIIPPQFIVQGLRQDVLDWLVTRQRKAVEKYGIEDKRIAAFIILDDVIADQKTIRYNADLSRFFVEGYVTLCFHLPTSGTPAAVFRSRRTAVDYLLAIPCFFAPLLRTLPALCRAPL